jgi:hypothetical protein
MSANFMFAIALMYVAAFFSFYIEGKYLWAIISLCWGIGNALLGLLAYKP